MIAFPLSPTRRWTPTGTRGPLLTWVAVLAFFGCLILGTHAQLTYPTGSSTFNTVDAVQLWYNGYWKHPGWINGTLVLISDCEDCSGKIVVMANHPTPYDSAIRQAIAKGAMAVIMLRDRYGTPGQSMYYVTGKSQADLTIPVVEIYQKTKDAGSIISVIPPRGFQVQMWPMENVWKKANDVTSFQIAWNVILSFFEVFIVCVSLVRLHEWFSVDGITLFSIGPLCIIFQLVGALVRLALTIVDPFFSLRILPAAAGMVLTTGSLPFVFASGILLTFFWAESLSVHRIQATPFIAEFKKSAICVVAVLFIGEIVTSVVRTTVPGGKQFNPVYLTQGFYVIVAVMLIICYLVCAYKITRRMKAFHNGKRSFVRDMSLRFTLSTSGYILFVITMVASIPLLTSPWGFKVVVNVICLSANIAAILQVWSLRPPRGRPVTSTINRDVSRDDSPALSTVGDLGKISRSASRSHAASSSHDTTASSSSSDPRDPPEYFDEEAQVSRDRLGDSTVSDSHVSSDDDSVTEMDSLNAKAHKNVSKEDGVDSGRSE